MVLLTHTTHTFRFMYIYLWCAYVFLFIHKVKERDRESDRLYSVVQVGCIIICHCQEVQNDMLLLLTIQSQQFMCWLIQFLSIILAAVLTYIPSSIEAFHSICCIVLCMANFEFWWVQRKKGMEGRWNIMCIREENVKGQQQNSIHWKFLPNVWMHKIHHTHSFFTHAWHQKSNDRDKIKWINNKTSEMFKSPVELFWWLRCKKKMFFTLCWCHFHLAYCQLVQFSTHLHTHTSFYLFHSSYDLLLVMLMMTVNFDFDRTPFVKWLLCYACINRNKMLLPVHAKLIGFINLISRRFFCCCYQ